MSGGRASRFGGFCAAAILFASGSALADRVPIGGRTATMGGAGVAAGNDSAMPYLNPAGLAGVPGSIFGVSASIHGYQRFKVGRFFMPAGVDEGTWGEVAVRQNSLASSSFLEIPSSVMYFADLGMPPPGFRYKVGVALVTPEATRQEIVGVLAMDANQVGGGVNETLSLSRRTVHHEVGPSVAVEYRDRLRVGLSLFASYDEEREAYRSNIVQSFMGGATGLQVESAGAWSRDALGLPLCWVCSCAWCVSSGRASAYPCRRSTSGART